MEKGLLQQLEDAKQKLRDSQQPYLRRVLDYLRIYCAALQKIHPPELNKKSPCPPRYYYILLLKYLVEYDPQWWSKCSVTPEGTLTSSDPNICKLLQPLTFLNE